MSNNNKLKHNSQSQNNLDSVQLHSVTDRFSKIVLAPVLNLVKSGMFSEITNLIHLI